MPLSQLRNVNLGRSCANATGSSGVGYTILNEAGLISSPRTTSDVIQLAPGIYSAYISFPDNFRGQILWDTGSTFPTSSYAVEGYNYEENNPLISNILTTVNQISGTIDELYQMGYGRWKIENNQMLFFGPDNLTEIARFNLFDDAGNPTMDSVFDRVKV